MEKPEAQPADAVAVPRAVRPGERVIAERRWIGRHELVPAMLLQTLLVRDADGDGDLHGDLAHCDEETRGWALLVLHDAGGDPSAVRARIGLTDRLDVPDEQWAHVPAAPNALPEPNPLFAALDDVGEVQCAMNRAEVTRVTRAVLAWREAQRDEGEPTAGGTPYQTGFFIDLAARLQVAESTAKTLVHTAIDLERSTPLVWRVFLSGQVPWRAMQAVHAELDGLDPSVVPAFDAAAAKKLTEIPVPRLAPALRRLRERLQASTADDRHESAARRRRVTVEPAADGMAWLHAYLPAADLLGLDHQLTKAAVAANGADGEHRGVQQLRADVLIDGLRDVLRRAADTGAKELLVPGRRGVEPRVAVLIPAMTALGHAAAPAVLQGYGPIGIRTALKLAAEAKSWVRVLTDPLTGAVRTIGREKYRPTKDMRTMLRLLDGGGRGPGCPRGPDEVDVDHVRSFTLHDEQGETGIDNLVLLSRRQHGVKTAGDADVDLLRDRTVVWSSASGMKHVTRPHDPPEPTPVPPELIDPDECPFWPAPPPPADAAPPAPAA